MNHAGQELTSGFIGIHRVHLSKMFGAHLKKTWTRRSKNESISWGLGVRVFGVELVALLECTIGVLAVVVGFKLEGCCFRLWGPLLGRSGDFLSR